MSASKRFVGRIMRRHPIMTTSAINTSSSIIRPTARQTLLRGQATASGWLLVFFLALAPVIPNVINYASGTLALIALIFGWPGLRRLNRDQRILLSGFALYVLAAIPSLINNSDWGGAGWRFESYHPFLLTIPLTGLLLQFRDTLPNRLLGGLLLAGIALGLFALYHAAWLGTERIGYASDLNPNIFGYLAALVTISLFAALITLENSLARQALIIIALTGALYAMLAAGSRGVMIAFFFSLVFIITRLVKGLNLPTSRIMITVMITAVLAVVVLLVMAQSDYWRGHWNRLISEFSALSQGDNDHYTSTGARLALINGAFEIWKHNFFIGTGLGDGQHDFERLEVIGSLITSEHPVLVKQYSNHIFHNIFADAFATTGLIGGTFMILTVLWMPLRYFLRQLHHALQGTNDTARFAAVAGIGICCINIAFGIDNSWLYLNNLPYTMILMTALTVVAAPPTGSRSEAAQGGVIAGVRDRGPRWWS